MLVRVGDIFNYYRGIDAVCIPTNGMAFNGRAVMGAGLAKKAKERYPGIDTTLGDMLTLQRLNIPYILHVDGSTHIVSLPTKRDFRDPSDLKLIEESLWHLLDMTNQQNWQQVWLPTVGCGLGKLSWSCAVEPIASGILDDRFSVIMKASDR